jgi:hypothetical protein
MKSLIILTVSGVLLVAAVALTHAQGAKPAATIKPVADVKQIMLALTIPSSTAFFTAAADPPKTEEEWTALQHQVITMTESANLLMLGSRAKDQGEWMVQARALLDTGEKALKAVTAKDADAMAEASDEVYATCESCHLKYMPALQPK